MPLTTYRLLRPEQIITVDIPETDIPLIQYNAQQAEIGGHSNIRSRQDRQAALGEDQLVGQCGNYAGSQYLTGSIQAYREAREIANQNRYEGDGGCDLPGYKVDIKGSRMRSSTNPLDYRLLVRPRELHEDWVYVLGLIRNPYRAPIKVHLVGWATNGDLPSQPDSEGMFRGAYVLPARQLRPMVELLETLEEYRQ